MNRELFKPPDVVVRFGQGMISFAIFCALFVAILTVFGFGLSWLNRVDSPGGGEAAQSGDSKIAGASASMLPSPPAQPAGHAEVKPKKKKADDK